MKKTISLFLAFTLLISLFPFHVSAFSEFNYQRTGKCNIIDFEETAMNRFTNIYSSIVPKWRFEGAFSEFSSIELNMLNSYFGLIVFDPSDLSISSIIIDLQPSAADAGADEQKKIYYKAISAISALEYSASNDDYMDLAYSFGLSKYRNGFFAASDIFFDEMVPAIENAGNEITEKNKEILIYSGCYDYYLGSTAIGGKNRSMIVAKAK